jgi:hypothetical protein
MPENDRSHGKVSVLSIQEAPGRGLPGAARPDLAGLARKLRGPARRTPPARPCRFGILAEWFAEPGFRGCAFTTRPQRRPWLRRRSAAGQSRACRTTSRWCLTCDSQQTLAPAARLDAGTSALVRRRASWPVGRVLCTRSRGPAAIHLGLPLLAASCGLPASSGGPPSNARAVTAPRRTRLPLDLAPGGVYRAAAVTCGAGGLLHRRFTLTSGLLRRRSVFCGTFPRVTPGRRYRPPCPAEPGPSSTLLADQECRGRPACSPAAAATIVPQRADVRRCAVSFRLRTSAGPSANH